MAKRNKTERDPLTDIQRQAVLQLAAGVRVGEVSAALGIHRSSIWRWQQEPEFVAALNAERQQLASATGDLLRHTRHRAIRVLANILDDEQAATRDQLAAAKTILPVAGTETPVGPTAPRLVAGLLELEMTTSEVDIDRRRANLAQQAFLNSLIQPG